MSEEIKLISENAIEAQNNSQVIAKSLVEFFKQCCIDEKVGPNYINHSILYRNKPNESRSEDYDKPFSESCQINFSDQPSLHLQFTSEVFYKYHEEKVIKKPSELSGFKLFCHDVFNVKYMHEIGIEEYDEEKIRASYKYFLSHGEINLSLTKKQYELLRDFAIEQKQTKMLNNEIYTLSKRLDEFNVPNPIKNK